MEIYIMRSYLFDPNKQFQDRNGVNNVNGFLRVFLNGTDDRATTYSNFNGTINPSDIPIDNNGRAVVIVDADKVYRLEVYSNNGNLLWSQYPLSPYYSGGSGGGVRPSDIKPLVLKQFGKTLGNYSPLLGNTIAIGNSVVQIDVSTSRIYSVIQSILADERTPVLVKTVHRDYGTEELLYYPTARTGASSDYYFIGYNGGLIEFAKVKDDDSVSYETYEGGEGRIVYIGYGDADIYQKVSDAFAAGLVPVVKSEVSLRTIYFWPLNLTAYGEPGPGDIDHRANNGYYFIGKETEFESGTDTPINDIKMLWVRPDNTKNVSGIPELYTARSKHTGVKGLKVVTNKFGQVTELSDGSISAFQIYTIAHIRHVLTDADISNGYFDVVLGLPEIKINGITLTPEFIKTDRLVFTASIFNQIFNGSVCSLRRLEVCVNDDGSFIPNTSNLICFINDFNKDEFGRNLDYHYYQYNNSYSYTFVKRLAAAGHFATGIIIRCYINPDYDIDPIVPGLEWVCSGVRLIVESPLDDFDFAVAEITHVTTVRTLRFRFSDPDYNPVTAGVGTSGTWTKRLEYLALTGSNVWDWTNYSSNWMRAFKNAWTSEDLDVEFVELVAAGDTSSVTDVLEMFMGCSALRSAIAFDTSNVIHFSGMFNWCTQLSQVPYFNTDSATHVTSMFDGCTGVKSGALALYTRMSGQSTPPSKHIYAFKGCGKDTTEGLAELQQIPASWGGLAP